MTELNLGRSIPLGRAIATAGFLLALGGCGGGNGGTTFVPIEPIPLPTVVVPASDGLLSSPELQRVVELQTARDAGALVPLLAHAEPAIRARAALALASVQDPRAELPLQTLLRDPDPGVRGNAAFALGQIPLSDGGLSLSAVLQEEADQRVRLRLIEAIGKVGGNEAVGPLLSLEAPEADSPELALALARAGLREVRPVGLQDALLERLGHPEPQVRAFAALYFGRTGNAGSVRAAAPQLREVVDGAAPEEGSLMYLLGGLARLGEVPEDAPRIARWMVESMDWRVRSAAASVAMNPAWHQSSAVVEALFAALEDPSDHVQGAAATSLTLVLWNSPDQLRRAEALVRGPIENWRVQAALLNVLAAQGQGALVVEWTERVLPVSPVGAARGAEAIAGIGGAAATELLFRLARAEDPTLRGTAVGVLGQVWPREGSALQERALELFRERTQDAEVYPALQAARALSHPSLYQSGGAEAIEALYRARRAEGKSDLLLPLLDLLGPGALTLLQEEATSAADPRVRQAAAGAFARFTGLPTPPQPPAGIPRLELDWAALAALGSEPRLHIETEAGTMILRLLPELAPLTVQAIAAQVQRGDHDGVRFHRVVPNFVIQGGDFGVGDGTGTPGYAIRSEFAPLPFYRGVIGMASAGKDTEGSQFFIMHSEQPNLDGSYTAFGWLESGGEVLDRIQQGDRVLRMRIEAR